MKLALLRTSNVTSAQSVESMSAAACGLFQWSKDGAEG